MATSVYCCFFIVLLSSTSGRRRFVLLSCFFCFFRPAAWDRRDRTACLETAQRVLTAASPYTRRGYAAEAALLRWRLLSDRPENARVRLQNAGKTLAVMVNDRARFWDSRARYQGSFKSFSGVHNYFFDPKRDASRSVRNSYTFRNELYDGLLSMNIVIKSVRGIPLERRRFSRKKRAHH